MAKKMIEVFVCDRCESDAGMRHYVLDKGDGGAAFDLCGNCHQALLYFVRDRPSRHFANMDAEKRTND